MGLRPTHRDESTRFQRSLIPNGLWRDFRRSVTPVYNIYLPGDRYSGLGLRLLLRTEIRTCLCSVCFNIPCPTPGASS